MLLRDIPYPFILAYNRCRMSKLQDAITRSRTFFADVAAEMRRCTWPERQELVESTVVVIVSVVMLSMFVAFGDKILVVLLKLLIRPG